MESAVLHGPEPQWGIRDREHLECIVNALLAVDRTLSTRVRPGIGRPGGTIRDRPANPIHRGTDQKHRKRSRLRSMSHRRMHSSLLKHEINTFNNIRTEEKSKRIIEQRDRDNSRTMQPLRQPSSYDRETSRTRVHANPGYIKDALHTLFSSHATTTSSTVHDFNEKADTNDKSRAFTDENVAGGDSGVSHQSPLTGRFDGANHRLNQKSIAPLTEETLRSLNRQQKMGVSGARRGSRQMSTTHSTTGSRRSRAASRHSSERSHPENASIAPSSLSVRRSTSAHSRESLVQSTSTASASTSARTSRHPLAVGRQRESNRVARENLLLADRILRIEVGRGPYNHQKQIDAYTRNIMAILPPIPQSQSNTKRVRDSNHKTHTP